MSRIVLHRQHLSPRVQLTLDLRRSTEASRTHRLFKITGREAENDLQLIHAPPPIDSVVNRASIHRFDFFSRTDTRGQKIRFDFVLARGSHVFCDFSAENGTLCSLLDFRSARAETAKRNERLGSHNVVFSEREGRRKMVCLASTAAFYLSVSGRHLTNCIQLTIKRERMYVQERNIFSQCEKS